jgi:lysozyme family protein
MDGAPIYRAFNEALYARGTGAQGGQFVSKGGQKSSAIGYDGTRGSGYGSKGGDPNVKALQKALNKLGITDAAGKPLAVDGKFGPKTTAAVRRLQKKLGLPVDGKVTPAMLKRIQGLKKSTTLVDAKPAAKPRAAAAKKTAGAAKKTAVRKPQPAGKPKPRKDGRAATAAPVKKTTPTRSAK